jgi:hypothetical protein
VELLLPCRRLLLLLLNMVSDLISEALPISNINNHRMKFSRLPLYKQAI